jgi:thioredoxin reductase
MRNCDVAIIGSGPYGLSIAAHLKAAGVDFRIFGSPMEFWFKHMPKGMHLKSEGFASSLYEPSGLFTLKNYCEERGLEYTDLGTPVPLEVFASYGIEFQKRYVPELEAPKVQAVELSEIGFRVSVQGDETFMARRVVVAVGQTYYPYVPPEFENLPSSLLSHSSEHSSLDQFKGKEVAIVGAGASALDLAALLVECGAFVRVIARAPQIRFQDPPETRTPTLVERMRAPLTGIGLGWKLWTCAKLPLLFRLMPEQFRIDKVRRVLGPAPSWFIKERVVGKVAFELGATVKAVRSEGGRVILDLEDTRLASRQVRADHLIAATGFRTDLRKLTFLEENMLQRVKRVENSPALSSNFESSVPNLYFVGVTAANTFGPLLRFAFGAGFAAPRISRHLSRSASYVEGSDRPAILRAAKERESAEVLTQ